MDPAQPAPPEDEWYSLDVSEKEGGMRVDRILAERLPEVGRRLAARLCEAGDVRLKGRRIKKGEIIPAGTTIDVKLSAWGEALPSPDVPLHVVYESRELVIVDKPPGIPTTALVGREAGTLAGALLARYPEMNGVGYGPREPGVLHRLDTFTSGLVLAARNQSAFLALRSALQAGKFDKKYLALVGAKTLDDEGVVESRLCTSSSNRRRVEFTSDERGQFCRTSFRVLRRGKVWDLVEASAPAAFRHQVRAHLAERGAALAGDLLYGGVDAGLSPRHALHASYIAGEASGVPGFSAELGLPTDLLAFLDASD